jgi:hypothetical protein
VLVQNFEGTGTLIVLVQILYLCQYSTSYGTGSVIRFEQYFSWGRFYKCFSIHLMGCSINVFQYTASDGAGSIHVFQHTTSDGTGCINVFQ